MIDTTLGVRSHHCQRETTETSAKSFPCCQFPTHLCQHELFLQLHTKLLRNKICQKTFLLSGFFLQPHLLHNQTSASPSAKQFYWTETKEGKKKCCFIINATLKSVCVLPAPQQKTKSIKLLGHNPFLPESVIFPSRSH